MSVLENWILIIQLVETIFNQKNYTILENIVFVRLMNNSTNTSHTAIKSSARRIRPDTICQVFTRKGKPEDFHCIYRIICSILLSITSNHHIISSKYFLMRRKYLFFRRIMILCNSIYLLITSIHFPIIWFILFILCKILSFSWNVFISSCKWYSFSSNVFSNTSKYVYICSIIIYSTINYIFTIMQYIFIIMIMNFSFIHYIFTNISIIYIIMI